MIRRRSVRVPGSELMYLTRAETRELIDTAKQAALDELEGVVPATGSPAAVDGRPLIVNGRMVYAADTEPLQLAGRIVAYRYTARVDHPPGSDAESPWRYPVRGLWKCGIAGWGTAAAEYVCAALPTT